MESELQILPFERMDYKDNQVAVEEVSVTYVQTSDCTEEVDGAQSITFTSRNNGTARFVCVKTDGWSMSCEDEFKTLYDDFCKRAMIEYTEDEEDKVEELYSKINETN